MNALTKLAGAANKLTLIIKSAILGTFAALHLAPTRYRRCDCSEQDVAVQTNHYTGLMFAAVLLMFALTGCKSMPPVPADKYYRIEAATTEIKHPAILNETLYIAPLRADGPYVERAMLYASAAQARELQQYHYLFWSEPPPVLLQEHMRASFTAMNISPHVIDIPMTSGIGYLLNVRILRLEKINDQGGSAHAVVSLHFSLQRMKSYEMILERSYSAEVDMADASQHGYVLACEAALKNIYERFAEDIRKR